MGAWDDLRQWQQAIGAVIGFAALAAAALFNAHLSRRRDSRLRQAEGRTLALSLLAEVKTLLAQLRGLQRYCVSTRVNNPLEAARKLQAMRIPLETVYPQVGAKIGLLEETTAQAVVSFYCVLAGLRTMVAVPMPELEPTTAFEGMYTIAGGEMIQATLIRAERLIPEVVELASVTLNKLTRVSLRPTTSTWYSTTSGKGARQS